MAGSCSERKVITDCGFVKSVSRGERGNSFSDTREESAHSVDYPVQTLAWDGNTPTLLSQKFQAAEAPTRRYQPEQQPASSAQWKQMEMWRIDKPGGEGGIRTPGTGFSPYNGLANRRLQPLGHLSAANDCANCSADCAPATARNCGVEPVRVREMDPGHLLRRRPFLTARMTKTLGLASK